MSPCEVASSYDQLAERWAGPSFNRSNGIAQHIRALQFVTGKGKALDVGCGSSGRFIDLLIGQEFGWREWIFLPRCFALHVCITRMCRFTTLMYAPGRRPGRTTLSQRGIASGIFRCRRSAQFY